jgi:hypothetical protein
MATPPKQLSTSEPRWQTRDGMEEATRRVLNQSQNAGNANQQPISRSWLATFVDNAIARWAASSNLASKKDVENAIREYAKSHPTVATRATPAPTVTNIVKGDDTRWAATLAWLVILTIGLAVCFGKIRKLGARTLTRYEKMTKVHDGFTGVTLKITNPWPFALKIPLVDTLEEDGIISCAVLQRDDLTTNLAEGDTAMIFSKCGIPIWIDGKSVVYLKYTIDKTENSEPEPTTDPNPADEEVSRPLPPPTPLFPDLDQELPTYDEDDIDIPAFLRERVVSSPVAPPSPVAPTTFDAIVPPPPTR